MAKQYCRGIMKVKQEWLKYAISELSNSDLMTFSVEPL